MISEEELWSRTNRDPLVPALLLNATLRPLVDEDWLNGELVVWLKQQMFYDAEPLRILQKGSWVLNRRTEVAGCSCTILDRKPVVATVPFEALVADTEGVSVCGGNYNSARRRPAFRGREIEPRADSPARRLHVIETH